MWLSAEADLAREEHIGAVASDMRLKGRFRLVLVCRADWDMTQAKVERRPKIEALGGALFLLPDGAPRVKRDSQL